MRLPLVLLLLLVGCSAKPPAPAATSLRLTYLAVAGQATTTQVTDLQPPYRARTVTFDNGRSLGGFLWDEGGTYSVTPDGDISQTSVIGPGFPGPASHLALALPIALRQHLVARLGPSSSGGRACMRWLSEQPLDGAPFSPATAQERTDSCVAADGTLLAETWTASGQLLRTRTLISQGRAPSSLYDGKRALPLPSPSAASVVKASTAAALSRLVQVPEPGAPAGLKADRAVAVLDLDSTRDGFSREAAVLTWVGVGHLAVLRIERDLAAGGGRTVRGEPVQLGQLGSGHLEPVLAGLRVLVVGPRGLRMIVTADLPEQELLSWMRSLRL